jgi:hypothetical protein
MSDTVARDQLLTRKKRQLGEVIWAETIVVMSKAGKRQLFWFERPENFFGADAQRLMDWIHGRHVNAPGVNLYSPFETDTEVKESQRLTLLGPQCKVTEGGA